MFNCTEWQRKFPMLRIILVLAICLCCYIFPAVLYGSDARVTDIVITNDASHLTVFAKVTNCFTQKMEKAILAGVPTTFTFLLELYQEREGWLDRRITGKSIKQTVKYDTVKKIFFVSSTDGRQPAEFQDIESAKKAMSELNGIVLAPVAELYKGKKYYIRIKTKLDKVRLPMHMEYVFFFVSLWDFETDWYQQKLLHVSW
jgi:hypothetical protein